MKFLYILQKLYCIFSLLFYNFQNEKKRLIKFKILDLNVQTFKYNKESNVTSEFILLYSSNDSALIGTRNRLINVSLNELNYIEEANRIINWSGDIKSNCDNKSNVNIKRLKPVSKLLKFNFFFL